LNRLRGKLTYANVIATLALFLVLAGGTAFAASQMLPKNSVGVKQIRKGAVTPAKLAPATKVKFTGPKGATGAQGPQGQPGVQGPAGAVRGFQAVDHSDAEVGTSPFGTTPISLAVPVATYFVTANLEFLSTGKDTVFCRLINGTGGPESEAVLREQSVASGNAENLTLSGLFTVRAGQQMSVECGHSEPGTVVRTDRSNIVAVQVQERNGPVE
jgi:hypothetical protein